MSAALFSPFTLRGVTLRNRIGVSPMCQYSAIDGLANAWHQTHLVSRAIGGAALVIAEATAISPEGRISPADLGIWSDAQMRALRPIADAIVLAGAVPGIQLAHAGRKGSTMVPWAGREAVPAEAGGWTVGSATAKPFSARSASSYALARPEIATIVEGFGMAARRAVAAGFRWIECHFAHGYLVHSFLSPLINDRTDEYGGDFNGRVRLAMEVVRAVRGAVQDDVPVAVRLSCVDWTAGGWTLDDSIRFSRLLGSEGVDLIDCSSGAAVPRDVSPEGPAIQRDFAHTIRAQAGMPTAAVGGITTADEADALISGGSADIVLLARAMLRDPYWALHAARTLGEAAPWPPQYLRAVGIG